MKPAMLIMVLKMTEYSKYSGHETIPTLVGALQMSSLHCKDVYWGHILKSGGKFAKNRHHRKDDHGGPILEADLAG